VRIAVAATPHLAIPTLDWLLQSEHDLIRVFTTAPKPSGRGGRMTRSDVAQWCEEKKITCIEISSASDFTSLLEDLDCVVVIAFGMLLPQSLLEIPQYGFINLHFSALPRWRGAAPVQRAIENGDTHFGATVFALDAGMDTGPIYHTELFERDAEMRASEALDFLADHGVALIAKSLKDIESSVAPTSQKIDGSSTARKLSKDEAIINWDNSVRVIQQKVLAFYPNPIARTIFRGDVLKITRARVAGDSYHQLAPGEVVTTKSSLFIGTSDGSLEILSVIPQGKSEMGASDWARGVRVEPGERCG
jgi:methionyl-tRNA formyltransferase